MLDRLDDALEPIARAVGGKSVWSEMKENAIMASEPDGGLRVVLDEIETLARRTLRWKSIWSVTALAPFCWADWSKAIAATSVHVKTCTLWAPACTIDFYREHYLPSIEGARIDHFAVFALTDQAEQDDNCANIYHKSLLYLVSNAFEKGLRKPLFGEADGEPLLGMEKFVGQLPARERPSDWVLSPNACRRPPGSGACDGAWRLRR